MSNQTIDFIFLNDYVQQDDYSVLMAKHLQNEVVIKDVRGMVNHVLREVARTGRKIGSITLAGHAEKGDFWIGNEIINMHTILSPKHLSELGKLAVHFAPDAYVRILQCYTAAYHHGIYLLSLIWPGVRVFAWTGAIRAYSEDHIVAEGALVSCRMTGCSAYLLSDPE